MRNTLAVMALTLFWAPTSFARTTDQLEAQVSVTSDYVFRGVSYTNNRAALQMGAEYRHSLGLYGGVWASNVNTEPFYINRKGSDLELDVYAGIWGEFKSAYLGWDLGAIAYRFDESRDNAEEVYGSLVFDPLPGQLTLIVKLSYDWDQETYVGEAKGIIDIGADIKLKLQPGFVDYKDSVTLQEDYRFLYVGVGRAFKFGQVIDSLDVNLCYAETDLDGRYREVLIDDKNDLAHGLWWLSLAARF